MTRPTGISLWVWNPVAPDVALRLADTYRVDRLLVAVAPGFTADPAERLRLTALCRRAAAEGLSVDALSGDPAWLDTPEVAVGWAHEICDSGLFDRLHLDVEPHGRPDWATRGPELRAGMIALVAAVIAVGPAVDLDLPFWYSRFTAADGERFDRALIRRAAGVTVLAYRNTAAAVLEVADSALAAADETGTPLRIGINVGDTGDDPAWTSYRCASGAHIRAELTRIADRGAGHAAFAGTAIHHLSALPEAGGAT